jgi:DNA-binding NarL/FixJ family response regulator
MIPLEIHGAPLMSGGRMIGRVAVCRVVESGTDSQAVADREQILQQERMRIIRGMRDAMAQVVFGVTANPDAADSFLLDIKRATAADLSRRLELDEVDLVVLRLLATGASNREIGSEVHLSAAAIKDRIRRLMDRLGTRRRTELAAHALRLGFA